VLWKTTHKIW